MYRNANAKITRNKRLLARHIIALSMQKRQALQNIIRDMPTHSMRRKFTYFLTKYKQIAMESDVKRLHIAMRSGDGFDKRFIEPSLKTGLQLPKLATLRRNTGGAQRAAHSNVLAYKRMLRRSCRTTATQHSVMLPRVRLVKKKVLTMKRIAKKTIIRSYGVPCSISLRGNTSARNHVQNIIVRANTYTDRRVYSNMAIGKGWDLSNTLFVKKWLRKYRTVRRTWLFKKNIINNKIKKKRTRNLETAVQTVTNADAILATVESRRLYTLHFLAFKRLETQKHNIANGVRMLRIDNYYMSPGKKPMFR